VCAHVDALNNLSFCSFPYVKLTSWPAWLPICSANAGLVTWQQAKHCLLIDHAGMFLVVILTLGLMQPWMVS